MRGPICPEAGGGVRGDKKASRLAKMTIFIQKTEFAKNNEKHKENQCFRLLQLAQGRPKMAPSPAKTTP